MPSRALPNLGLIAFFDLGENGWDDEISANFLALSVLVQGTAIDFVSATPGAPVDKDVYVFKADHPTDANKIAVYDVATWKYFTPVEGWEMWNRATNQKFRFDGAAWVLIPEPSSGVTVTTQAGNYNVTGSEGYVIFSDAAAQTVTLPAGVPTGFQFSGHRGGAGTVTFAPGAGANIRAADADVDLRVQYSAFTATKISATDWALAGDLA